MSRLRPSRAERARIAPLAARFTSARWLGGSVAGLDPQVVLLSLTSLVIMLGSSIITPALPLYAREFGVTYAGAGMLVSAFAAGRLAFDYVGGELADRVSPRFLTTIGALVTAVSAFLCARAASYAELVVYRVIEGIGSAFYVITIMAIFARTVDAGRMGKSMGFYQSMILLGVSFGPSIGGVVAQLWGLRAPFYAMSLFGVAVGVVTWNRVDREVRATREEHRPRPPIAVVARHVTSLAFLYVFVLTFFVFAVRAGMRTNLIPLFGAERGGLAESAIGFILSVSAFANFVVLWHAGELIDRRGRQWVALPTLAATGVLCAVFAWSPAFVPLLLAAAALGAALGYLAPAPAAMVADLTPREMLGAVIGVYRMAGDLGLLVGPVALGFFATRYGFEAAFFIAAAGSFATLAIGLAVPETLARRKIDPGKGDE
jgi:MFS family permease